MIFAFDLFSRVFSSVKAVSLERANRHFACTLCTIELLGSFTRSLSQSVSQSVGLGQEGEYEYVRAIHGKWNEQSNSNALEQACLPLTASLLGGRCFAKRGCA